MAKSRQKRQPALRGLWWVCGLRPRIPLSVLAILLTVLLVLWRSSTLSLEPTAAAASTAEAATGVGVSACSTFLFLLLDLSRSTRLIRHRTRDRLGRLINVEVLLNDLRNGLNLSTKFLFDPIQVETVFPVDQVNSQTQVSKTTRTTNTMQIRLCVLGKVKVDYNVDCLDIDTTGEQVGADKVSAYTITEVVENAVTVVLEHTSMRVETRVAEFGNLLSEELDSVRRVTEDDRLVDLELVEEGVQAVDLLLLFNESVVLRDTTKCELVH